MPSHQQWHVKFADTFQGGLTSIKQRPQEEVALVSKPIFQNHPEETGLHVARHDLKKYGS